MTRRSVRTVTTSEGMRTPCGNIHFMKGLDDIKLSERDRAAIEDAAEILRGQFPVEQIVLFGSKSRGDDDPESDIDLLVLTSRPLSRAERHAICNALYPIELSHDVVLSALIIDREEWRSGVVSVLPIHAEIDEQGVAV